jgi:hypothetical protein
MQGDLVGRRFARWDLIEHVKAARELQKMESDALVKRDALNLDGPAHGISRLSGVDYENSRFPLKEAYDSRTMAENQGTGRPGA